MTQTAELEQITLSLHASRKTYLDILRAIAIIAVVIIHVGGESLDRKWHGSSSSWWAANCFLAMCRWAVPVFIMISGALLLDPSRLQTPGEFYRRRLLRIGLPLVFWSAFYLLWRKYFLHEPLTHRKAFHDLASGIPQFHLYFLFAIAGLYLITPLLRAFIQTQSRERQLAAAVIALLWTCSTFLTHTALKQHESLALTFFLPYVGFYLMGYLIASGGLPAIWYRAGLPLFIVSVLLVAGGTGLVHKFRPASNYMDLFNSNNAPLVILMSLGLFAAFVHRSRHPNPFARQLLSVRILSSAAFGIYLVHPAVMNVLSRLLALVHLHSAFDWPHTLVAIPFWTVVTLGVSLGITLGIQRIPVVRNILGS